MKQMMLFIICFTMVTNATIASELTADKCRPFINAKEIPTKALSFDDELKCIQLGHREIMFESNPKNIPVNLDELLSQLKLEKLTVNRYDDKNQPPFVIVYTPAAKKDALLLQKYFLEVEASKYFKSLALYVSGSAEGTIEDLSSAYATGKLIKYKEEDIHLFYQRRSLLSANKLPKDAYGDPQKIIALADQHKSLWEPGLQEDILKFNRWLNLNQKLTEKLLETQNNSLNEMIKNLIQVPLKPVAPIAKKSAEQPSRSVTKKSTSWWKKPAAFAAAVVAAGAAAYAYLARPQGASKVPTH